MHLTGISTAVVVTIAAVVAGPLFAPTPASAADPAPVATGQCATLTYAQITEKSLPDDLASIPCDQLHTFEVTGVFTVPDHLAAQGWDSMAVSALLATKCEVVSTTYPPQRLGWNMPNRAFSGVAFRPTQPQWDAGARWYVCGGTGYDANYQDVHAYRGTARSASYPFQVMCAIRNPATGAVTAADCAEPDATPRVTVTSLGWPDEESMPFPGHDAVMARAAVVGEQQLGGLPGFWSATATSTEKYWNLGFRLVWIYSPTGPQPDGFSAFPDPVTFGDVPLGQSSEEQSVVMTNVGDTALTYGSGAIRLAGAHRDQYAITQDACSGVTVAPQDSCTVAVVFQPSSTGDLPAVLAFDAAAPGTPREVALSGAGVVAAPPRPSKAWMQPQGAGKSVVSWRASDGAREYDVVIDGRVERHVSRAGQGRISAKYRGLLGPLSKVRVIASNSGGESAPAKARYRVPKRDVTLRTVRFHTGPVALTTHARRQLRATARLIETQGFRTVIVAGYSARYGRSSPSYRRLISQRRADLTTAFLRDRLPASVQFTSHGFGARHPVASNNTAKGRAQNRRAVVSVR